MKTNHAIQILKCAMTSKEAKTILQKRWMLENKRTGIHCTGFCYNATEALYHMINNKEYQPYVASYIENGIKNTHWWLQDKKGNKLDPTASQYFPDKPPYNLGRKCGFLTGNKISKRSKILMDLAIKVNNENQFANSSKG